MAKTSARRPAAKSAAAKPATKAAKPAKPAAKPATKATKPAAVGFGPETFAFLAELEHHNERPWFEANRERYERCVRGPALAWITAIGPALKTFAPHFVADARPSGGSLMRIHRDTRFAADKRPYKSHIGMHFRHASGKDIHAPGLYVHVEPGRSMLGVGLWHPEPEPLANIRAYLVEHPERWVAVTTAAGFRRHWKLEGESLVRVPRGFDPAHPLADALRRKDHIAMCTVTDDQLAGPVKPFVDRFAAAAAYLGLLCDALDLAL
jgi:uncharacterized protein (TIGR02453 family)